MSASPLPWDSQRLLVCLALILVGCVPDADSRSVDHVKDTLSVLVHEGGPRFTAAQPELISVMLLKSDGAVMTGRLLESPKGLRTVAVGDTIRFVRVPGYEHPIFVTNRYLMERRHSYVVACNKCGFTELFDCPSDLAGATFPGQPVSTFTARCPICAGSQLVRLLPSTPSTPRNASASQFAAAVRSVVAEQLDSKNSSTITLDQPLSAQGADELDLVEILFALEEKFVVHIPDKQIGNYDTVTLKDLITVVANTVAERRDDELLSASD